VLRGLIKPWECRVFGTACTPQTPIGTCMVSSEGACAAYYTFGRMTGEQVVVPADALTVAPAAVGASDRDGGGI
jgi:hydrogenase expression/formation protein HypD